MENRHRDKVSQSDRPTEAGQINRKTSERRPHDDSADFGQSIGRSEDLNSREDRDSTGSSPGRH